MQSQSHFVDIYRSMARVSNDSFTASLQTTERIHQKQLEMVRSALEQSTRAAKQLGEVQSVDELFAAQSQLFGTQMAHTMEMWRSLFRAMSDTQLAWMSQIQNQVGQATEGMRQAYDLTKRATEDATRTVVSQVGAANTNGGSRESGAIVTPTGAHERKPDAHRKSA
jgi:hypothetical protein